MSYRILDLLRLYVIFRDIKYTGTLGEGNKKRNGTRYMDNWYVLETESSQGP